MREFMLAVKNGMTYHFGFIKVDEHEHRGPEFIFQVTKSSFPNREMVNRMITLYRQESAKTLYTAKNSEELQEKFEKRPDLIFGMVFEEEWRYLKRLETVEVNLEDEQT